MKITKRPRVLVIDDAPENLMVMESVLGKDYDLQLVSDAREALACAATTPPDLILLDVMMPGIDGFDLCRRLKADAGLAQAPVIFITARTDVADEEQGFSVGASDFIHKPISAPIVAARVRTHLRIKLMTDYLQRENAQLQQNSEQNFTELEQLKKFLWGASQPPENS